MPSRRRTVPPVAISTDNPTGDAFSRLRVSAPEYVFDASFEYDLHPLLFESTATGTGATVTHDATERSALLAFDATTAGGVTQLQTYEYFRYQPGRSQLVFVTFNLNGGAAGCRKYVGYSDGNNGIELQTDGTGVRLALLSDTSKGDEYVPQQWWDIDRLDGTGPSGKTLDLTKTAILVIDLQWLGVGRVRVGFDIDGVIVIVHEFVHAGIQTVPYMQTANLPVRAGMAATDTVTTSMRLICCSVISEGGQTDPTGYAFTHTVTGTAGNNTRAHILSLRPKATFNAIPNRSRFVLEAIDVMVTGNSPVMWELVLGQGLTSPTYGDVNAAYSAISATTAGTLTGDPALVIGSGHVPASASLKAAAARSLPARYPITLDRAGSVRPLGTLTLLSTGIGAASAIRAALSWREVR